MWPRRRTGRREGQKQGLDGAGFLTVPFRAPGAEAVRPGTRLSLTLLRQRPCVGVAACLSYGTKAETAIKVYKFPQGSLEVVHDGSHQAWHLCALVRPAAQLGTDTLSPCRFYCHRHGLTRVGPRLHPCKKLFMWRRGRGRVEKDEEGARRVARRKQSEQEKGRPDDGQG